MLRVSFIALTLLFISSFSDKALSEEIMETKEMLCDFMKNSPYITNYSQNDAAYVPGVDVHGKAVVPADVGGSLSYDSDIVRIPVTVDMVERLNIDLPEGTELKAGFGVFEISRDGHVLYNNQDVTQKTEAACQENPVKTEEDDVKPMDDIHSEPQEENGVIWGEGH